MVGYRDFLFPLDKMQSPNKQAKMQVVQQK